MNVRISHFLVTETRRFVLLQVGFVNEMVTSYIDDINNGQSKIAESGHTLILGWNESTVRVVTEVAWLRKTWRDQNSTWTRRMFPWTRVPSSTPVDVSRVVVVTESARAYGY